MNSSVPNWLVSVVTQANSGLHEFSAFWVERTEAVQEGCLLTLTVDLLWVQRHRSNDR